MNESQISVMNYSQMYSCDIGLQGSRGKGFSKYRRIFRYVGWNRRVTGMHICTTSVCSYPSGFIGGWELQKRRAPGSRGIIGECLRDLLVKQAIICIEWLSRRIWSRDPKVRVSKIFNPKEERDKNPEYRRGIKDPNTTQLATWARKPHSQVSKIVFGNTRLNCGQGVGKGLPTASRL